MQRGSPQDLTMSESARNAQHLILPLAAPPRAANRAPWGIWVVITISAMFVVARLAAPYTLLADLMANVSYFASVPLALAAIVAFTKRRWGLAAAAVALAVAAAAPIILAIECGAPVNTESPPAKILVCNIGGQPAAVEPLLALIDREEPHLVAIVEAEKTVVERLLQNRRLSDRFPFRVVPRIGLEWPHVILSRHPLEPIRLQDDKKRYGRLFTFHRAVMVATPAGTVVFSVEHLPSPRRTSAWQDGNLRIRLLGELVRGQFAALGRPIIIAGDFNSTPAGFRYGLLRAQTGLHPDSIGVVPVGTWPSWLPNYCRLPLDRVWGSDEVVFLSRTVLENIGSDHCPVLVKFRLKRADLVE